MALVNHNTRKIQFKIVYFGTPRSGKTTNLSYIHRKLDPYFRSDLESVETLENRTVFFDFLSVSSGMVADYQTRFDLYSVPGQQVFQETRETVLAGADGVIFVADSAPDRQEANRISLETCHETLDSGGYQAGSIPMAFQLNKRDLPGAVTAEEMDQALAATAPSFLACAAGGHQVFATLDFVTQIVLKKFHRSHVGVNEGNRSGEEIFETSTSSVALKN